VFGGSQGARAINDAVLHAYRAWSEQGLFILWQTGERDYERIKAAERENLALKLQETVMQLMEDDQKRQKMQHAWKPLAHPEAADKIARVILNVAGVSIENQQPVMEQPTENP